MKQYMKRIEALYTNIGICQNQQQGDKNLADMRNALAAAKKAAWAYIVDHKQKRDMIPGFLTGLLLNEDRETYSSMSAAQQRVVRFALLYGKHHAEENHDHTISQ